MMKKMLLVSVAATAFVAAAPSSANAQIGPVPCFPVCPPVVGSTNTVGSGTSGAASAAWGVIGVATWFAVLNPRKGSDSILGNTIHQQWWCGRKDWRERCRYFVTLTRVQQNALRRQYGVPLSAP